MAAELTLQESMLDALEPAVGKILLALSALNYEHSQFELHGPADGRSLHSAAELLKEAYLIVQRIDRAANQWTSLPVMDSH